jgi:cyclic pyranopterin monophosphate synthase
MVNIGQKSVTRRIAVAEGTMEFPEEICDAVFNLSNPLNKKGDIKAVSSLAGVVAAKKTSDLIPLCHQVPLNQVSVDINRTSKTSLEILASADATARTGVEMEALTAVSVTALTLYDMTKSALKGTTHKIIIRDIHLRSKSVGDNSFSD